MITLKEILKGKELLDQSEDIRANLAILLDRINKIRTKYGKPMIVTSGLRTMEDHLRIYREKAEKAGVPFDQSKVPMGSRHLTGGACDISETDGSLKKLLKDDPEILEEAQLWCEDFSVTTNWIHFQISPPKSGKRFFLP